MDGHELRAKALKMWKDRSSVEAIVCELKISPQSITKYILEAEYPHQCNWSAAQNAFNEMQAKGETLFGRAPE